MAWAKSPNEYKYKHSKIFFEPLWALLKKQKHTQDRSCTMSAYTDVDLDNFTQSGSGTEATNPAEAVLLMPPWAQTSSEFNAAKFLASLQVTGETAMTIAAIPQRTQEWHQERWGRLTASNYGAAAYHGSASCPSPAAAARDLLGKMLYPELASASQGIAAAMMAYGTNNEPVARDVYTLDRLRARPGSVYVYESGLCVSLEHGWLAASPDFFVDEYLPGHERDVEGVAPTPNNPTHARPPYVIAHASGPFDLIDALREATASRGHDVETPDAIATEAVENTDGSGSGSGSVPTTTAPAPTPAPPSTVVVSRGCGEIKCPARSKQFYSSSPAHVKYGVPVYYYDQIQGVMAITERPWCDMVVFTPTATEVTRFYFDATYWRTELQPALWKFYSTQFLPRAELRARGIIKNGALDPALAPLPALSESEPEPESDTEEEADTVVE